MPGIGRLTMLALVALELLGCSASEGEDGASRLPASTDQADIEAFLAARRHDEWTSDPEVRGSDSSVNVHGSRMRVFFNEQAVQVKSTEDADVSPQGTMVVKEFYDADGSLLGSAVEWKTGEGSSRNDWTYYCDEEGPGGLCTGRIEELPLYGAGITECGFCHGQVPYAPLPSVSGEPSGTP